MASKDNFQASPKLIADEPENQAQILTKSTLMYLGEIFNAASTVDAGNVGGSAGAGITLTEANVYKIPNAVTKKFQRLNVNNGMMRAVVSPDYMEIRNTLCYFTSYQPGDKAVIRP